MKIRAYKKPQDDFYTIVCVEKDFMEGYVMFYSKHFSVARPTFSYFSKRSLNPFTGFRKTTYPCIEGVLAEIDGKVILDDIDDNLYANVLNNCSCRTLINNEDHFFFLGSGNQVSTEDGMFLTVIDNDVYYWYDLFGLYK